MSWGSSFGLKYLCLTFERGIIVTFKRQEESSKVEIFGYLEIIKALIFLFLGRITTDLILCFCSFKPNEHFWCYHIPINYVFKNPGRVEMIKMLLWFIGYMCPTLNHHFIHVCPIGEGHFKGTICVNLYFILKICEVCLMRYSYYSFY